MELRQGYKQTEVGVVPKDWEIYTVQDLIEHGSIIGHLDGNHGELYPRSHEFRTFGIPYITANDLSGRAVNFNYCKHLSEERAKQFRKGVSENGDVLFAHNATVGPTALLSTALDYVILSTTVTYFRCNLDKLNNLFFLYLLQSPFFVWQYRAVMAQSTRNQIPITAQRKLSVTIPPTMAEQEAIAGALSDVDGLIAALETLISKKRHIKKGAMQELLRPKEGWVEKRLDEIADIDPENLGSDTKADYSFKYISLEDVDRGTLKGWTEQVFATAPSRSRRKLRKGDVLVSTVRPNLQSHFYVQDDVRDVICSTGFSVVRCRKEKAVPYIVFSYLFGGIIEKQIETLVAGSNYPAISSADVRNLRIFIPEDISEQTAIATILSDMDAEITALEVKLTKTRQLKQGMMGELLTGKIRLVDPQRKEASKEAVA